jgi:hypothetical protein
VQRSCLVGRWLVTHICAGVGRLALVAVAPLAQIPEASFTAFPSHALVMATDAAQALLADSAGDSDLSDVSGGADDAALALGAVGAAHMLGAGSLAVACSSAESDADLGDAAAAELIVVPPAGIDCLSDHSDGAREGPANPPRFSSKPTRDFLAEAIAGKETRKRVARRIGRVLRPLESRVQTLSNDQASIARVWNQKRLRVGEQLCDGSSAKKRKQWVHPNAWTMPGTISVAFARLGNTTTKRTRITSRTLDACAAVSVAFQDRQEQNLNVFRLGLATKAAKTTWIWLERAWDETPVNVRFGTLLDLARPVAQYWWRDGPSNPDRARSAHVPGAWTRLSYEDRRRRSA